MLVQEVSLLNGFQQWAGIIKGGRIDTLVSVCERPETMGKAMNS